MYFLIITSDKSYKNEIDVGYKESDILGGDDPYSASKGSAELVIQSYCKSFFKKETKKIGIARAGNVIGDLDWSELIIPDCIKSWSRKKTVFFEIQNQLDRGSMFLRQFWLFNLSNKIKKKLTTSWRGIQFWS